MNRPHHIIYIPGLGEDRFGAPQAALIKLWKIYKFDVHYQPMNWADGEAFMPKLERIVEAIDKYAKQGTVSLVGASAGASAAINAYAARREKVQAVVCICGKLRNPQTVVPEQFKRNPAFKYSLALLDQSFAALNSADRHKICSVRPQQDRMVPPSDTTIKGAHVVIIPTNGHALSILYALTIGSRRLARFIKSDLNPSTN